MEKLVYLMWRPVGVRPDDYRDQLLDSLCPRLLDAGVHGLTVHVDDGDAEVPPSSPGFTGRPPFEAVVSLWVDDHTCVDVYEQALSRHCQRYAGYLVTESLYTDYGGNRHSPARDWVDGQRSNGVVTITLLERPDSFDYEHWVAHWYGVQSPVSEAMQPRSRYVRNAVVRGLTADAPYYGGIVEEAWPSAEHMTDPYLFYGATSFSALSQNMAAMMRSVTGFLALPRIQNVTLSEYFVRTWDGAG